MYTIRFLSECKHSNCMFISTVMFTCDGTGFSTQHSFLMDEYLSSRWLGNITTTICREGFTCSLMALMYVSVQSLGSSSTMGSLTCNREYNDWDTYLHQLHHDNYSTCTNPHSNVVNLCSYALLPSQLGSKNYMSKFQPHHVQTPFPNCNLSLIPLYPHTTVFLTFIPIIGVTFLSVLTKSIALGESHLQNTSTQLFKGTALMTVSFTMCFPQSASEPASTLLSLKRIFSIGRRLPSVISIVGWSLRPHDSSSFLDYKKGKENGKIKQRERAREKATTTSNI